MTRQGNGQPARYEVTTSEQIKATIKKAYRAAVEARTGPHFLSTLRHIYERLRRDPHGLGEALYRLPALHLIVCHVLLSGVAVDFAVHEELPLVFIRGVKITGA
jgi:hypothetical protein